jgi:hypothetical protein
MVVHEASSPLSGKALFLMLKRVSASEERPFQNARSCSQKLLEEKSPYPKVIHFR